MSLQVCVSVVGALECVVRCCLGPDGGSVLFTRDTGETLITRHGQSLLNTLHLQHPMARSFILTRLHLFDSKMQLFLLQLKITILFLNIF